MKIDKAVVAAILVVGGSAALIRTADAQVLESLRERQKGQKAQPQQARPTQIPNLSREENSAILPLYQAVRATDWPAATAALPAARAGAATPHARYLVGQLILEIGRGTSNAALQGEAVDAMIASGGAPPEVLPQLLAGQAGLAIDSGNFAAAEAPLTRIVEMEPNNVQRLTQLAQVKLRLNKRPEAFALYQRILQISEASGQQPSEEVYRGTLSMAYEARQAAPALELSRKLLTAYPANPENWRSALGIYRELGGVAGGPVELDLRRLMRATQALVSERDYADYAEAVNRTGLPGEAKGVIEEGIARNVFRGGAAYARQLLGVYTTRVAEDRPTIAGLRTRALAGGSGAEARTAGDVFYGYGQYGEAAELYRAAMQKGGEDSGLLNTRLGAALAMAGRRAEAEAAFRAVTGPRQELARFWLLWLSSRPA